MPTYSNIQPSLVINETIALQGLFPSPSFSSGGVGIGFASMFAFNFAPRGSATASGQILSIAQNSALFSILGTTYGGNGQTTFALPRLNGSLFSGTGTLDGTFYNLGQMFGSNNVTTTNANLPVELGGTSQDIDNAQLSLAGQYVIVTSGRFPSGALTEDTIGVVHRFYGNFAPGDTMPCDGRLLNISEYTALFAVLGTTYGGDGITTFALPDLRGRTIIGSGVDDFGQNHTVGDTLGSSTTDLTLGNMGPSLGGNSQPIDNYQPSLVMNVMLITNGIFPSRNQAPRADGPDFLPDLPDEPTIGQLLYYAGVHTYDFNNAVRAGGQLLSINQNQALFSLLGTTYGGDGITTFGVPDFEGRAAIGSGTLPGGTTFTIGEELGSPAAVVGVNDIPARTQIGTDGDDLYYGGTGADLFMTSDGNDIVHAGAGNDTLNGNAGSDQLNGGIGNDILRGGLGDDAIFGGDDDDMLNLSLIHI